MSWMNSLSELDDLADSAERSLGGGKPPGLQLSPRKTELEDLEDLFNEALTPRQAELKLASLASPAALPRSASPAALPRSASSGSLSSGWEPVSGGSASPLGSDDSGPDDAPPPPPDPYPKPARAASRTSLSSPKPRSDKSDKSDKSDRDRERRARRAAAASPQRPSRAASLQRPRPLSSVPASLNDMLAGLRSGRARLDAVQSLGDRYAKQSAVTARSGERVAESWAALGALVARTNPELGQAMRAAGAALRAAERLRGVAAEAMGAHFGERLRADVEAYAAADPGVCNEHRAAIAEAKKGVKKAEARAVEAKERGKKAEYEEEKGRWKRARGAHHMAVDAAMMELNKMERQRYVKVLKGMIAVLEAEVAVKDEIADSGVRAKEEAAAAVKTGQRTSSLVQEELSKMKEK